PQPPGARRTRRRTAHARAHPPEENPPHRPKPAPQGGVLPARFGYRRTQFSVRQGSKNRENGTGDPSHKDDRNEPALAGHLRRLQKDSRPDHRTYDDRARSPRAQTAHQFQSLFAHVVLRGVSLSLDCFVHMRLTIAPTAKVTRDPISTYQVNATCVNRYT